MRKPSNVSSSSSPLKIVDLPTEGPWIQRARDIKATKQIDNDLDRKFHLAQSEIKDLILQLKLKEKSLEEANVKIKLLDSRMGNVKKQTDRISLLEKQIAEAKARETQFEEAIENLNGDLRNAETEVGKWRKAAKDGKVGVPTQNDRSENFNGPRIEETRLAEQVPFPPFCFAEVINGVGGDIAKCVEVFETGKYENTIEWRNEFAYLVE